MRLSAACALFVLLSAAGRAAAQDCAPPDLLGALPVDGAIEVPTDAAFRARYAPTAEHRDEIVVLQEAGGAEQEIPAVFEVGESSLVATPDALSPHTSYVLRWPGLGSVDGTTVGAGAVVAFTTGDGPDAAPPSFGGLRRIEWDAEKAHDPCVESAVERFVFDLELGDVGDDTGPGTVGALVFLTRGPDVAAGDPPLLVTTAPMPSPGEPLRIRLSRDASEGEVCMSVAARDLAGHVSGGGEEVCVVTTHPPFFGGCSAARARPVSPLAVLAALTVLVGLRRRALGR